MATDTVEIHDMPKKQPAHKTTPVRLSDEAIKWCRIASGYTGESVAEYASRVLAERGQEDADKLHVTAKGTKGKGSPR
jgi:hypothetical protein